MTTNDSDIAQLAKGGRTNVVGFVLRLVARLPFLAIAGRVYGAAALGRMAYAVLVVEFCAQIASNGMRRGLALQFARGDRRQVNEALNALIVSVFIAVPLIILLRVFPHIMFPHSVVTDFDYWLPLVIIPIAWTDTLLAALAFKFDVKATVRARSIVEPWTISIAAFAFIYVPQLDGLVAAYALSMFAAFLTAAVSFFRTFGVPRGWRFEPIWLGRLAWSNLPLSAADAIEWGSRRIDLAILGLFMVPEIVGIYYIAQQVASLPQRLKNSFEPVLGPVIARKLLTGDKAGVAAQISQVGFWILAAQLGIALTLSLTANGIMGLVGPKSEFVGGAIALTFLMIAEVLASPAVVSEAALIYISAKKNLAISALVLIFQAAVTLFIMMGSPHWGWSLSWQAAGPAMALAVSLLLGSLLKVLTVSRALGTRVRVGRWALLWAALAATAVGMVFRQLPEWIELCFGIPLILATYCFLIWRYGFAADDRQLFTRASLPPAALDPEVAKQH